MRTAGPLLVCQSMLDVMWPDRLRHGCSDRCTQARRSAGKDPPADPGSRICNGLGIMRQCLETQTLDRLGERLDQLENTRGEGVSYGTAKHDQPHHVAH